MAIAETVGAQQWIVLLRHSYSKSLFSGVDVQCLVVTVHCVNTVTDGQIWGDYVSWITITVPLKMIITITIGPISVGGRMAVC